MPAEGATVEGMGTVVRRRPGVGGEVCLPTLLPPAVTTTLDTPQIFPVRLAISRLFMLPTLASDARIATSWDMCTSIVHGESTQAGRCQPPDMVQHARRVHPEGSADSRHGNTPTVKPTLPPLPFKGMPRLPMRLTPPPPPPSPMRPLTTTTTTTATTTANNRHQRITATPTTSIRQRHRHSSSSRRSTTTTLSTINRRRHRTPSNLPPAMPRSLPLRLLPERLHLPRANCIF